MADKKCSVCGGTISGHSCQSICTHCYNEFFYTYYPTESGIGGEHGNNWVRRETSEKVNDPTDI